MHQPPATGFHSPGETNGSEFEKNYIKRIVTKSGHRITLVDTPGKETISLATPTSNRLMLTESHADTGNRPAIVLESAGDIIMAAPNGRIHTQSMHRSAEVGVGGSAGVAAAALGAVHGAGPATAVQAPAQAGKPTGKAAAKGAATGAAKKPAPCTGKGMSTSANEKEFAGDMNKLQTEWPKLKPSERQAAITAAANKQLTKTGAPPVTAVNNPKLGPTRLGELDFHKWSLSLNPKLTSSASLSKAQTEELGSTVFHETRHANQWYMMAQNQAGSGKSASDIASTTFLPANVARKAAANPIKKGDPLFDCSTAMQQSVYGSGATHREQTLTDLRTTGDANVKANSALDAVNANPKATAAQRAKALSDANAAYTKAKKANDLYRALPEEADAWQSGDAVGALLH